MISYNSIGLSFRKHCDPFHVFSYHIESDFIIRYHWANSHNFKRWHSSLPRTTKQFTVQKNCWQNITFKKCNGQNLYYPSYKQNSMSRKTFMSTNKTQSKLNMSECIEVTNICLRRPRTKANTSNDPTRVY